MTYEVPYFGGRARGRRRPRAPSLAERPNGLPRSFSINVNAAAGFVHEDKDGMHERIRYESPESDEEVSRKED